MGERQLLADALHRLVEAQPRLDADHQQVERVRQRQADPVLALLGHPRQHHAGQHVAEAAPRQRQQRFGRRRAASRAPRSSASAHADADAEEDDSASCAAVAGLHQPLLQLAHLRWRLRRELAEPLERADDASDSTASPLSSDGCRARPRRVAVDRRGRLGASASAPAVTSSETNSERQQRQQNRHAHTSILMTC